MDRFIELVDNLFTDLKNSLKSNMDRFIGCLAVEKFCFNSL